MLSVVIPEKELFVEESETFYKIKETKLQLEHSLLSVKKWESKWHKAFLKKDEKTDEELLDYIRCMTLTTNVDPMVYLVIPPDIAVKIISYINDPYSATNIGNHPDSIIKKNEVVTAEVIYYWMITLNIPVEFQKWHLNQLITLINVIAIKNEAASGKKRKLSPSEAKAEAAKRNALNDARRAKYHTKG